MSVEMAKNNGMFTELQLLFTDIFSMTGVKEEAEELAREHIEEIAKSTFVTFTSEEDNELLMTDPDNIIQSLVSEPRYEEYLLNREELSLDPERKQKLKEDKVAVTLFLAGRALIKDVIEEAMEWAKQNEPEKKHKIADRVSQYLVEIERKNV